MPLKDLFQKYFYVDLKETIPQVCIKLQRSRKKHSQQVHQFKLVELGIVDADILISELSMPSALHT